MRRSILDRLNGDRAGDRAVALVTALEGSGQALVYADGDSAGDALPEAVTRAARDALSAPTRAGRWRKARKPGSSTFTTRRRAWSSSAPSTSRRRWRAWPRPAGYSVIVCDPRRAFADDARFPAIEISTEWPDDALNRLVPDHRTAVVTLTHDPKIDDPALEVAVRAPVFYIGALGSRRTHGKRLERLREKGFSDDELGRIHAPIGLAIGARSPAEIAVLHHGRGDAGAPPAACRLVTSRP